MTDAWTATGAVGLTAVDETAILIEVGLPDPLRLRVGGGLRIDGASIRWAGVEETDGIGRGDRRLVAVVGPMMSGISMAMEMRTGVDFVCVTVTVTNGSLEPVTLTGLTSLVLDVPEVPVRLDAFTSRWGLEFEPTHPDPEQPQEIRVESGRSAEGASPLVRLVTGTGPALAVSVHASGNWLIQTSPVGRRFLVAAGLPTEQAVVLEPGESRAAPTVSLGWGAGPALASRGVARSALERAPAGPPLWTEWNHWWPYEDRGISEDAFLANAAVAADLGLEVAVLDAGWFGDAATDSDWVQQRGDWHKVNTARFPHGLAWLAERTRALGIEFGLWVEAEAVGSAAELATLHPEFLATSSARPDGALGYVCLGSPDARAYVLAMVRGLIAATRARWIKWDFNLDPGSGCDRDDHGHRRGDGLIAHYRGLYSIFDALRAEFPDTVFEACSSGGLRFDPGLAEHVDCLFLSDPDWTEHHLACLWGASQMLPPRQLLHWMQSEWRTDHRFQKIDYSGSLLTCPRFDLSVQAAMLHRFGVSVRLPQMRPELRDRLARHLVAYKEFVRPLLEDGLLIALDDQPLREEHGNRSPAFQLSSGGDHVVAAFRLPPLSDWEPVRPIELDATATYEVRPLDLDGRPSIETGASLMTHGIPLPGPESCSTLVHLRPVAGGPVRSSQRTPLLGSAVAASTAAGQ